MSFAIACIAPNFCAIAQTGTLAITTTRTTTTGTRWRVRLGVVD